LILFLSPKHQVYLYIFIKFSFSPLHHEMARFQDIPSSQVSEGQLSPILIRSHRLSPKQCSYHHACYQLHLIQLVLCNLLLFHSPKICEMYIHIMYSKRTQSIYRNKIWTKSRSNFLWFDRLIPLSLNVYLPENSNCFSTAMIIQHIFVCTIKHWYNSKHSFSHLWYIGFYACTLL